MGKTKIEYLDYTWNFVTGCNNWKDPMICGGGGSQFKCWAKSMADRFGGEFKPEFNLAKLGEPYSIIPHVYQKKTKRIGICFTGDLFSDPNIPFLDWDYNPTNEYVEVGYYLVGGCGPLRHFVFQTIRHFPQHQFYFLTKCPWNLHKWGRFPDNAWVGVSVTNHQQFSTACDHFAHTVDAKNKWISFEPLLEDIGADPFFSLFLLDSGASWVVIGGLSNKPASQQPKLEWIQKIDHATGCGAKIPVFIKDNIIEAYPDYFSKSLDQMAVTV